MICGLARPVVKTLSAENEVFGLARFREAEQRQEIEALGAHTLAVDLADGEMNEVPQDFDYVLHFACSRTPDFETDLRANSEGVGLLMSHCRRAKGFLACFATNRFARPVEGGFNFCEIRCVDGETITITKDFISTDALSAVRAQLSDDPDTLDSVEGFAAFAQNASDGKVLDAKRARARAFNATLAAAAQMRNARGARLRLKAFEEAREKFWRGVGVTDEIIESIDGVESYEDLDKFPELALLGNPDCPAYERCRELIFASQRRGNRGEADAFKNKVRTHLGRDLIIEVLHARFPDLVAFPDIIEAMADRVHFDHIFSSACAGRCLFWGALHSTVVSTENATRAALLTTAAPLAGDHMMNLLIDFDTLNEHFGARRRLPDFATARARRRGIGREQRRASLASAI